MKTLKKLTKDFDYVNSDITLENFPLVERKHKGYKLFHFDRDISSEDAIVEMAKEGYAPANLLELLSWTKWNKKDWVVALGSVAEVFGGRHVPYLGRVGSERRLGLFWFDGDWDARYRFLAVRNLSSEPVNLDSALGTSDTLALAIETVKKAGYVVYRQM